MAKKIEKKDLLDEMEEKFGQGVMVTASSKISSFVKEWVQSGSFSLDLATGGGFPKGGRCTCILGKESSSKTTVLLHAIANETKKGNLCSFNDVEGTLDLDYAHAIGVDLNYLHIVDDEKYLKTLGVKDRKTVSGEEWLELIAKQIESNIYSIVGLDSVAAFIPKAEIDSGLSGGRIAGVAAMAAKGYRLINSALKLSNCAFIYLNQFRMNPGNYIPLTEPFGEAWKYLQSLKIEISKSLDKDTEGVYGIIVKGKVTKSKVGTPYKPFEYYVEFGKGIIKSYEIINIAIELDIIQKTGNTYSYKESKLGVGRDQLDTCLHNNPSLLEEIEQIIVNFNKQIL